MFSKAALIPALAIAGRAAAQCSTSGTFTIQNQADAGRIAACATYTGSIAIATDVATDISISGVRRITEDLIADNSVLLPSLGASSLESIGGNFNLINMTVLTSLTFPRLAEVGSIAWQTLPRLSSLGFGTGVREASTVSIIDTQLGSLEGINLETVDQIYISNNNQLNEIEMALEQVTQAFTVEYNGRSASVSLPSLTNAYNMTFRNVAEVNLPALATVNSSIGFWTCTFETVAAPNLTAVGTTTEDGSLTLAGNDQLTNASFPELTGIRGALLVANNTALSTVDGFASLARIGGAINMVGVFTEIEFPVLANVAGAFTLESTEDIGALCDRFEALEGRDNVIRGSVECTSSGSADGQGGSSTGGSGGSGGGNTTGAAGRGLYARSSAMTGVLGVFAAMIGML